MPLRVADANHLIDKLPYPRCPVLLTLCVMCVSGGADELSHVDFVERFFLGIPCSPLRQRSGLIKALTALRSIFWWLARSLRTSEVCLSRLPSAGFKEGTLLSSICVMNWTEPWFLASLAKKKEKGKRNFKWQLVNIYKVSHYLTQNSNIRAPLCWEADILQMAITYQ